MTGDRPFKTQRFLLALVLGCCGYIAQAGVTAAADTNEAAVQQKDLIPQDDIVFRTETSADQSPVTYSLQIHKEPSRIKFKGSMSSEDDYRTLVGMVTGSFPGVDPKYRVKITDEPVAEDVKIGGLSFALKLLGYVENGRASVDNNRLSLHGEASTAVVLTEVNKLIENDKPTGMPMEIHISRPEKNWQASVSKERVVKISGVIKNTQAKQKILELISARFPGFQLEDKTALNDDVSDEWEEISLRSVEMLSHLEKGSVEVTEQVVNLKGDASNGKAVVEIDSISGQLPGGIALKSEVTAPAPPLAGIAAVPSFNAVVPQ